MTDMLLTLYSRASLFGFGDNRSLHVSGFTSPAIRKQQPSRSCCTAHLVAPILVHEPSLTADVGFVGFDFSSHLVDAPGVHGIADAMDHEPRSLLRDLECPRDLIGTDSVFAIGNEPHRTEPFLQRNRAVFEDGPDLDRELLTAFQARPHEPRRQERQALPESQRGQAGPFTPHFASLATSKQT